jgi:hypothetical protein
LAIFAKIVFEINVCTNIIAGIKGIVVLKLTVVVSLCAQLILVNKAFSGLAVLGN